MTLKELKEDVRNAVSKNEIELALNMMLLWFLESAYKDDISYKDIELRVVQLSSRWSFLRNSNIKGVNSQEEFSIEMNKISLAILELLNSITITALQLIHEVKDSDAYRLDLGNCGLTELPDELFELQYLEELIISNEGYDYSFRGRVWERFKSRNDGVANNISFISPKIKKMKWLKKLIIGGNYNAKWDLTDLSPLKELTQLQVLGINNTRVWDLSPLKEIPTLQVLNMGCTPVSEFRPLQELKQLEQLLAFETAIKELVFAKTLTRLQRLDISNTQINSLIDLKTLKKLEVLDFSDTEVSDLSPLKNLTQLSKLSFDRCNVTEIAPIKDLNLVKLDLLHNPILDCPQEVYLTKDIQQIRVWFNQHLRKTPLKSQEITLIPKLKGVKLIFIGNAAVGKTQFVEYITTNEHDPKRLTTHGILINNWQVQNPQSLPIFKETLSDMMVNIWDFGGQEYYHGTHRLFLSNRAVYVLLFDAETNINGQRPTLIADDKQVDLEHFNYHYWLDSVRAFAPDSPILMLQNKIDIHGKIRLNKEDFDDYTIKELHHISLLEGAKKETPQYRIGLERSFYDLAELLAEEGSKSSFPNWQLIVDELRKVRADQPENDFSQYIQHKAWVSRSDFKMACEKILETPLSHDESHTLPRWLNNTGEVLFFADNPELNDRIFINPQWVTSIIYQILNDKVKLQEGKFKKEDLFELYDDAELTKTILAMMLQMDIVFQNDKASDDYIAPQYLPDKHPIEDLYRMVEKGLNEQAIWIQLPLFFYKKLMHHLLMYYGTHPEVDAKYFWKHGIVLIFDKVRILIKGLYPAENEREGKILIGVEPNPKAIDIQKQVFGTLLKVLFATFSDIRLVKDTNKADFTLIRTGEEALLTERIIGLTETGVFYDTKGYLFNEEIKEYVYNIQKPAPRWLKHLNISVNGEDFVNYLHLFRENEQRNPFIHCVSSNKTVKVNAFSAFLSNTGKRPLKVFFSYSHTDMDLMQRLHIHLAPLRRMDRIATWSDREILPGSNWDDTIKDNLKTADIVLLLVSADFVASDYIWEKELKIIEERQQKGEKVKVLSILLRPMDYSLLKFSEDQMLPKHKSGKLLPVSLWEDKEDALAEIAKEIRKVIDTL